MLLGMFDPYPDPENDDVFKWFCWEVETGDGWRMNGWKLTSE